MGRKKAGRFPKEIVVQQTGATTTVSSPNFLRTEALTTDPNGRWSIKDTLIMTRTIENGELKEKWYNTRTGLEITTADPNDPLINGLPLPVRDADYLGPEDCAQIQTATSVIPAGETRSVSQILEDYGLDPITVSAVMSVSDSLYLQASGSFDGTVYESKCGMLMATTNGVTPRFHVTQTVNGQVQLVVGEGAEIEDDYEINDPVSINNLLLSAPTDKDITVNVTLYNKALNQ